MQRSTGLKSAFVLAVIFVTACEKKESPAPAATGSAAPTPSATASAPPASASKLRVLIQSKDALLATGANGEGVVVGRRTGISIAGGKLSEVPDLARGLENPAWSERQIVGQDGTVLVIAGKRDPGSLQKGDQMMYMEDPSIDAERTVFRSFQKGAWVRVSAVKDGESLGGIGRFRDRVIAAIQMPEGKDYRFVLIAGKPGFVLPAPTPADKPKPPEAEVPSEPEAEGDAAPSASAPPVAGAPAKPPDPSLPNPDPSAECETRLVPRAFDGLSSGEAILVGRVCPGNGEYWVEHWAEKKRKAGFEKIPQPTSDRLAVAMTTAGRAVVAQLGSRWAIERSASGSWSKLDPPGSGEIEQVAASPAGRLWLIAGGQVFSRTGDAPFTALALPSGKHATRLLPADGDEPFVVAGNELLGPASALDGDPVSLSGRATSLCREPYVIVKSKIKRTERFADVVEKVKGTKVPVAALVFGHRGMLGADSVQAKMTDMKGAQELAKALAGAEIVCGAPRTEAPVPGFE
jgi:hypothetical protein